MKIIKSLAVIVLLLTVGQMSAQATKSAWPALKNYHEVMARTFHPAEEGNLVPIKTWSETLMQTADALTAKPVPAEFNTKAVTDLIPTLQQQSKKVYELVLAKASDAEITKALTDAHDTFHKIAGLCKEKF